MGSPGWSEIAREVARSVAAVHADEVHRDGRFPKEALEALREARLLGAMVPTELGGPGASVTEMIDATRELANECANTAMIFAMHQIQLAILVRHGSTPELQAFQAELVEHQLLVANAFSEVGVGGDARRSVCCVEQTDGGFRVSKQASVVSYGVIADAVLVSARRAEDATAQDQTLMLGRAPGLHLEPTGEWDTIGLRGTDSRPFVLTLEGPTGYLFPEPGDDIICGTGIVVNNVLQGAVWLGIAESAAQRAHNAVRSKKDPEGLAPAPLRLAELAASLQQLRDTIDSGARMAEAIFAGSDVAVARFTLITGSIKISSSKLASEIVQEAMVICGIDGFRNHTASSLGRHLGDVMAGLVMVNNDRVLMSSGQILKMLRRI